MTESSVVHLPYNSGIESHWEIQRGCTNCGGTKEYETVRQGVDANGPYNDRYLADCTWCNEKGNIILDEIPISLYENFDDVLIDYPISTKITKYIQENKS